MNRRHRWVWHHDVSLRIRGGYSGGGADAEGLVMVNVRMIAGREDHCSRCGIRRRMTDSGSAKAYSTDGGGSWVFLAKLTPACRDSR